MYMELKFNVVRLLQVSGGATRLEISQSTNFLGQANKYCLVIFAKYKSFVASKLILTSDFGKVQISNVKQINTGLRFFIFSIFHKVTFA